MTVNKLQCTSVARYNFLIGFCCYLVTCQIARFISTRQSFESADKVAVKLLRTDLLNTTQRLVVGRTHSLPANSMQITETLTFFVRIFWLGYSCAMMQE